MIIGRQRDSEPGTEDAGEQLEAWPRSPDLVLRLCCSGFWEPVCPREALVLLQCSLEALVLGFPLLLSSPSWPSFVPLEPVRQQQLTGASALRYFKMLITVLSF